MNVSIQPTVKSNTLPISDHGKMNFVCVKAGCGINFVQYTGMKRVGRVGLGYCREHNPVQR